MQDITTTPFGSILGTILIGISIYYIWKMAKWQGNTYKKFIYFMAVPLIGLFISVNLIIFAQFFIRPLYQIFVVFQGYIILGSAISFHLLVESKVKKWIAFK